jgi:hypothetical protein
MRQPSENQNRSGPTSIVQQYTYQVVSRFRQAFRFPESRTDLEDILYIYFLTLSLAIRITQIL